MDTKRLSYNGYGNWEMAYPFARTKNQMKLNRRVEIKVIPCHSEKY
jgi:flagellar motor protein MotB